MITRYLLYGIRLRTVCALSSTVYLGPPQARAAALSFILSSCLRNLLGTSVKLTLCLSQSPNIYQVAIIGM